MEILEEIERLLTKIVATNKPGRGLPLVGGFRFRLLNDSPRLSADVDYHWEGDLAEKRTEVAALLEREFLPRVEHEFGYVGSAVPAQGPGEDSTVVKVVRVSVYKPGGKGSRIAIPVDIMRIPRRDEPLVVTREGTVYLTLSDTDMIEAKVLAVCNRTFPQMRDMVDLFLFGDYLKEDSGKRVIEKMAQISLDKSRALASLDKLADSRKRHVSSIDEILDGQMETDAADRIRDGGGAEAVFDRTLEIMRKTLGGTKGGPG